MLHDGNQYTPMVVLVCVGLKALGLSSNCIRDAVVILLWGLNILLPTYKDKKGNTQPYWPSASTIDSYDGVAEELCNVNSVMMQIASARATANRGGDRVLDNHVGLVSDGFMRAGEKFQNTILRYFGACGLLGTATTPLKSMAAETGKAKADTVAEVYTDDGGLQHVAEILRQNQVELPTNLTMGGTSQMGELDIEANHLGNLAASTTDRGAPEVRATRTAVIASSPPFLPLLP